jgi:phosphoglycerate dehydrogenase-like enzyme
VPATSDAPELTGIAANRIGGAAIDVFDPEPRLPDNPLRTAPNCVFSPHMAGVTAESVMRILAAAVENCQRVARGESPRDVLGEE